MRQYSLRRFGDADVRRKFVLILGGKMLGIASLLALMKAFALFFENAAGATVVGQVSVQASDVISPINTVWVLVTAFLVFFMQAGFMALEAGFARSRAAVKILMS